jgi:hypothetical protein
MKNIYKLAKTLVASLFLWASTLCSASVSEHKSSHTHTVSPQTLPQNDPPQILKIGDFPNSTSDECFFVGVVSDGLGDIEIARQMLRVFIASNESRPGILIPKTPFYVLASTEHFKKIMPFVENISKEF